LGGSDRDQIEVVSLNIPGGTEEEETRKISVTMDDISAEIRTDYLPNMSEEFTATPAHSVTKKLQVCRVFRTVEQEHARTVAWRQNEK
jgi:hypothetical protein